MTNWAATIAAGLSLTLVVLNAVLVYGNQANQFSVTQRQQFINQGSELVRIEQAMVRNATAAVGNGKDAAFVQLLARYDIRMPQPAAPAPVIAPTPAAAPAPVPASATTQRRK